MAGSVNRAILIGNVGRDPEVRTFQSGGRVANLSLATSESWKDKQTGERKERTEWHRVVVLNDGLVGVVEQYVRKGSKIYVEGQIETRKFTDQSGAERYTTEIVLRPYRGVIVLLDGRQGGGQVADAGANPYDRGGAQAQRQPPALDDFDDLDDEIPF